MTLVVDGMLRQLGGAVTIYDVGLRFGWVVAHEFAHNLGLFDEYFDDPFGTGSRPIPRPDGQPENFMSSFNNVLVTEWQDQAISLALDDPDHTISLAVPGEVDRLIAWYLELDVLHLLEDPNRSDRSLNPDTHTQESTDSVINSSNNDQSGTVLTLEGLILGDVESDQATVSGNGETSGPSATAEVRLPNSQLINGDFSVKDPSADGFGWTVTGDVTVGNSPTVLREDPRFLTGLTQSFVLPEGARTLRFTILDAGFESNVDWPPDAFEFALLDSGMQSVIGTITLSNTDAAFNVQSDGTVFTSPRVRVLGLDPDGRLESNEIVTVEADLSGIAAGTVLNLFIDLIGFGPTGSEVWIDNVRIVTEGEEVNDPPVAADDLAVVDEDASVDIPVLSNDSDPDGDAVTILLVDSPVHGSVLVNPNGTVTYAPAANFFGADSFTYRIGDEELTSSLAQVSITVTPVNDAPVAVEEGYSTDEDTRLVVMAPGVLGNDTDVDGDSLSAILVAGPAHGTLTLEANGAFSYLPELNYFGGDGFTYRAHDGGLDSNVATVRIEVRPVNDAPVVVDAEASTVEDTPLVLDLANLASDVDSALLTLSIVTGPAHGALSANADGSFRYTPALDYFGDDSFSFRANDGQLDSNVATFSLTITPVNHVPVARSDAALTDEDHAVLIDVRANDSDADGDALTVTAVSGSTGGAALSIVDGQVRYDPGALYQGLKAGESAADSFSYTVADLSGATAEATVTVTIGGVNDAPVAGDDDYALDEDHTLAVSAPGVLANDTDLDGDPLSATLLEGPQHGTLTLAPEGSFVYLLDTNFNGMDGFSYAVSDGHGGTATATLFLTVRPINDAPVAQDDALSTLEDTPLTVVAPGLLGNDTDVDSNPLTATMVSGPAHGTLSLNTDGSFTYTPAVNYSGADSFTYTANDGSVDSNVATVALTVTAVNDAPVTREDRYTTDEDASLTVVVAQGVLANDTDVEGDPLTAELVAGPAHGALTLHPDGSFVYTPTLDFHGADSFTYLANDGIADSTVAMVAITVTAEENQPPVAQGEAYTTDEDTALTVDALFGLLANDTDPNGDPLTAVLVSGTREGALALNVDGSFTYTPRANFFGEESFSYRAYDGAAYSNVATVTIAVNPVNDAPVAEEDQATTAEDAPVTIPVLANDYDWDGDQLSLAVLATPPGHGVVAFNPDGTLTYTPAENFFGSDSFSYKASDGVLLSNEATVSITVNAVNDAPVALGESYATDEDQVLTALLPGVLGNDTDVDGDSLSAILVAGPAHGTLTLEANGAFSYLPELNYFGGDGFTYRAHDGGLDSNVATVRIEVRPVNDAPVVVDAEASTVEDTPLVLDLANLASDVDSALLTLSIVTGPAHGALSANADGSFRYTPALDYFGDDSFSFRANDGQLDSNVATFSLTITPVNHVPVARSDAALTDEDHAVLIDVRANDSDADGDALTVTAVSGSTGGAALSIVDGQVRYDPGALYQGLKAGESAADSFSYTVADLSGATAEATVTVTIGGVNDAPQFITTPVTSLVIEAPRSQANLDSVFQAAGARGSVVKAGFELLEREDAKEIGIYRVDDLYGTVRGIAANDAGYASAALARSQVAFARGDHCTTSKQLTLEGGALYAFYIVQGEGHGDDRRGDCNERVVLFSIAEANADGRDHMQASLDAQGRLTIKWDDSDDDGHNYSGNGYGHEQHNGNGYGHDDDDGAVVRATGFAMPLQTSSYVYDADAIDIDGDTLTYRLVEAPNGATIDAATGLVNWTPQAAGQYRFVIRVEDGQGGAADQAYNLEVTRGERLLEVRGTDCNDQIEVSEDEGGIVHVTVNGATRSYSGITRHPRGRPRGQRPGTAEGPDHGHAGGRRRRQRQDRWLGGHRGAARAAR